MKKQRGAQPGNDNAYLHGFYSTVFRAAEARLLDDSSDFDLNSEVELIRVMNFRFLDSLKSVAEPLSPETQLSALRAVTLSAQAITGLIRLQQIRQANNETMDEIMDQIASISDDDDPADPNDPNT